MHFQCVDYALQHVDNGFKRICNVTQSIVKMLTMFNKCLRMDEKCFSMRWQLFPMVDLNAAQTLKTQDVLRKLTHTLSTQPIAMFTCNKYSTEHQNSASGRIWFCLVNKEQFSVTGIKTFAEQQPIPTGIRNAEKNIGYGVNFFPVCPQDFLSLFLSWNNHSLE